MNIRNVADILGREPVHPFPARMAPGIALDVLAKGGRSMRVLDPMAGSGTVLAVARSQGHRAYGVDIDPLAVLIATVWTTTIRPGAVMATAHRVLARAKSKFKAGGSSFPDGCDPETKQFISYWFDPYARRQLKTLADALAEVDDVAIKNVLWCAFSRLIITKQAGASLAMDLAHSRPHKTFQTAPIKPFAKFLVAVERVVDGCITRTDEERGPATQVRAADARKLPHEDSSIDLVLTSPPYLNAIDYMRCSKFTLVWMNHQCADLRRLRSVSVGSEVSGNMLSEHAYARGVIDRLRLRPPLPPRELGMLARYVHDMHRALGEVTRVLKRNGHAVYVVGENTVKGTYIRNSLVIEQIASTCGLTLIKQRKRTLPENRRYLPPPLRDGKAALDVRMRREVVLEFTKD